jgi:hypothetical protein
MVCAGAMTALADAGLGDGAFEEPVASIFGTSYGEIAVACRIFENGLDPGLSPTAFHNSVHNAALGYLAMFTGLRGPSLGLSDSTLSGEECIVEAASLIEAGEAPAVVAGAGDESCPSVFSPCWRRGEDAPRRTARSIESEDRLHTDEGCGFVVLETLEDARRRGARVLAVIEALASRPDLGSALGDVLDRGRVDAILVPAGLDRETDPEAAAVAARVAGPGVEIASDGASCGYVPASGVIRCVLAAGRIAAGAGAAITAGIDLDGHAIAIRLAGAGGG